MKTAFFSALVFCFALLGCSKKSDPAPVPPVDLVARISGTYQVNRLEYNNVVAFLPSKGISMGLKITSLNGAFDRASCLTTYTNNGKTDTATEVYDLKQSRQIVELWTAGEKAGEWADNQIALRYISPDGNKSSLVATK